MANKWNIGTSTNYEDLLDKTIYNSIIEVSPLKSALPNNAIKDTIWNISTLAIPDSSGNPIYANTISILNRPKYYFDFYLMYVIKLLSHALKESFYNWLGNSDINLLAQYINTNITNISVQDSLHHLYTKTIDIYSAFNNKTEIFESPEGKTVIVTDVIIRNAEASMAGYTNNKFGGDAGASDWNTTIDLSSLDETANTIIKLYQTSGGVIKSYSAGTSFGIIALAEPGKQTPLEITIDILGYII